MIWERVRALVTDPDELERGIEADRQDRNKETAPLRERLRVVDDLLEENRGQLARLLDLNLEGDFPKEMLLERRKRLEATIHSLEKERAGLIVTIESRELTATQIHNIREFAATVASGLLAADDDFQARRAIVEALDVNITLALEDGEKAVYLKWIPGTQQLPLVQAPIVASVSPTQTNASDKAPLP